MLRSSKLRVSAHLLLVGLLLATGCQGGLEDQLGAIRTYQEDGQFEESIEPLREILATTPDQPEANYLLGLALLRTGRLGPAVWPLRKAAETEDYAKVASQLLGFVLISTRNYAEAIAAADRGLARDPEDLAMLLLRVQANFGARRLDDALADAERALAIDPKETRASALRATSLYELERWDESQAAYEELQTLATESGDRGLAGRACIALASAQEKQEHLAAAQEAFEGCAETYPGHPQVLGAAADFYVRLQQPDKAVALWRGAVERSPESLAFRQALANQLQAAGDPDGAVEVLTQAVEDFASPEAWESLSELHRRNGRLEAAAEALEQAAASGGDSDRLRFRRADLLVDTGDFEGAMAIADGLPPGAFQYFVRARVLLLARNDPAGALEALDRGLALWPDNAPARSLAGRAAQELGDYERAFAEYRQAIRANAAGTDSALAAAHLAHSLGRQRAAMEYVRQHITSHGWTGPEVLVLAMESAVAIDAEARLESFRTLLEAKGRTDADPAAVGALAEFDREHAGPAAAIRVVVESGLDLGDPANEPALRALVDAQVEEGRAEESLARVDRVAKAHPDSAPLQDLRGRVLAAAGRSDEARAAFESALAADPGFAPSLAALGTLAASGGDPAGALAYYDRAVAEDPTDAESAYRAAQIALLQGQRADAERRLRGVLAKAPSHAGTCNDLAWILAEDGEDLDLALNLAERAVAQSSVPDFVDTLAFVQLKRGEAAVAADTLEAALGEHPDSGVLLYRLGLARAELGDRDAALQAFRHALRDQSFAEPGAARAEIARLEAASVSR